MLFCLFIKSFAAAFLISMPTGPVNLLCIRQTLARGWKTGFVSGLGSATADTIYSILAAFGLSFIIDFLLKGKIFFELGGGLFLCCLGVSTLMHVPNEETAQLANRVGIKAFAVAFFLSISNLANMLLLMAIFATLTISLQSRTMLSSITLVLGVLAGASCWWFTLCSMVSLFRHKFTEQGILWLNRVSGGLITLLGLYIILYLLCVYLPYYGMPDFCLIP